MSFFVGGSDTTLDLLKEGKLFSTGNEATNYDLVVIGMKIRVINH